jgi:hypothetical protein
VDQHQGWILGIPDTGDRLLVLERAQGTGLELVHSGDHLIVHGLRDLLGGDRRQLVGERPFDQMHGVEQHPARRETSARRRPRTVEAPPAELGGNPHRARSFLAGPARARNVALGQQEEAGVLGMQAQLRPVEDLEHDDVFPRHGREADLSARRARWRDQHRLREPAALGHADRKDCGAASSPGRSDVLNDTGDDEGDRRFGGGHDAPLSGGCQSACTRLRVVGTLPARVSARRPAAEAAGRRRFVWSIGSCGTGARVRTGTEGVKQSLNR